MILPEEVISIGTLRKPHGTRGEIACVLHNDYFDLADPDYLILELDHILVPFFLEEYRYKNDETVLLKFEDIDTERQAARLTNTAVCLHRRQLPDDMEVQPTADTLIGYTLFEEKQGRLGIITDIDTTTVNTLFSLDNGMLFPAHDDFIVSVDEPARQITMRLPEGLLNLSLAPSDQDE